MLSYSSALGSVSIMLSLRLTHWKIIGRTKPQLLPVPGAPITSIFPARPLLLLDAIYNEKRLSSSGSSRCLPYIVPVRSSSLPVSSTAFISSGFIKREVPCVPSGRMSKPRLSCTGWYPDNQLKPLLVSRHARTSSAAVSPSPVSVNGAIRLRNGFTTQMLAISLSTSKDCRIPSRTEFTIMP